MLASRTQVRMSRPARLRSPFDKHSLQGPETKLLLL